MRSLVWATFALACAVSLSIRADAGDATTLQVRRGVPASRSIFHTAAFRADESAPVAEEEPGSPSDETTPAEPADEPAVEPAPAEPAPPAENYYQEQEDAAPAPSDYMAAPEAPMAGSSTKCGRRSCSSGQACYPAAGNHHGSCCQQESCSAEKDEKPSCCGEEQEEKPSCCGEEKEEKPSCCGEEEEEAPEDKTCHLFDCCCLKEKNITIQGWVDFGFTYNPDDPVNPAAGNGNLPQAVNYRSNEFMLDQLYLYAEKATKTDCCHCFDIGWRADVLFGEDYIWTEALGLELEQDGTQKINSDHGNGIFGSSRNGLAIPQMYLEVAWDDVKVKLGHFYTLLGYEVIPSTGNFFYSHVYTCRYGEPTTHTGALATWKMNDRWSLMGGFTRGWDNWEDTNEDLAFLGGVSWTSKDEKTSAIFSLHTGAEDLAGVQNRYVQSFVLTRKLGCKCKWVFQTDYGFQDDASPAVAGEDAEWYSVINYLFYDINDCWSAGLRYEWMNDDDGFRNGAFLTGVPGPYDGHYQAITAGLNWKPGTNLIVRPEARWDWFDPHSGSETTPGPYDNLTSRSQFTLGVDVIVKF